MNAPSKHLNISFLLPPMQKLIAGEGEGNELLLTHYPISACEKRKKNEIKY